MRLAQAIEDKGRRAVIVNADSAQVYADLQVLSARPTDEETGGIEHRLFGTWDGAQACSAADWASAARGEIEALHRDGAVPILVGGTGLYIRTLLDGIADIPAIDPQIRREVRGLDTETAYARLLNEDPVRAAALAPADNQRITRALEVVLSTGKPLGEWQQSKTGGIGAAIDLHPLILLPDREWLYDRCDRRFAQMLELGAVAEVEELLARELDPALPVMRAIGVPEIAGWLRGDASREAMITAGQQATRNYAKRQYTWFRRQPPQDWPRAGTENIDITRQFARLLQN